MMLNFKTAFPWGEPTNFDIKIIMCGKWVKPCIGFVCEIPPLAKLHTIRQDKSDRWHTGQLIHFARGARTKKYLCFANGSVQSTQKITINSSIASVAIDGRELSSEEIAQLAINDGFDCIADFLRFFNKPFTGKLIHWTVLRY